MPRKRWDFSPEPNEQHRRIAAEHKARELVDLAKSNEDLMRASDLLIASIDFWLDTEHASQQEREAHIRRIATKLLSDSVFKLLGKNDSNNS
jgi:predicted glycosyltransferase